MPQTLDAEITLDQLRPHLSVDHHQQQQALLNNAADVLALLGTRDCRRQQSELTLWRHHDDFSEPETLHGGRCESVYKDAPFFTVTVRLQNY
jgi:hypothetical protein